MNKEKILKKCINSPGNVRFTELQHLVKAFGFLLDRVRGSHHIYVHKLVKELINLQNVKSCAKPYQVKQFLSIIEKYDLRLEA